MWSDEDTYSSIIQFCPWCGRKLEALNTRKKPDPVLIEQEVITDIINRRNELEKRLNNTNRKLNQLCEAMIDYINGVKKCGPENRMLLNSVSVYINSIKNN